MFQRTSPFPCVEMQAVSDAQDAWVALRVRVPGADEQALLDVFGNPELFASLLPLDCILQVDSLAGLSRPVLELLPPARVLVAVPGAMLGERETLEQIYDLQALGYRLLLDGAAPDGVAVPVGLQSHFAYGIDSKQAFDAARAAGYTWFAGQFARECPPAEGAHDGTSKKRLLSLLGLLARDAESREIEAQLKQDPALSYQLLKLANSAAFALSSPISSFGQAISLLGRRQLQRWLQLLLYARQDGNDKPSLLLPLAAQRAAQMESLCKQLGADREQQDLAFMTGVFSLLDTLLQMPMEDIVGALSLPSDVAQALLHREGRLGRLLSLCDGREPEPVAMAADEIDGQSWLKSLQHAYHWAIQVSRNL